MGVATVLSSVVLRMMNHNMKFCFSGWLILALHAN